MAWVVGSVAVLVGLIVVLAVAGSFLPQGHRATRAIALGRPPDEVWKAITDVEAFPTWRPDVRRVERLPDRDSRPVWREHRRGGPPLTLETVESSPPTRLVGRIADKGLPFGGTWTYEIAPVPGGCTIRITEDGEVYNPIFRLLARYVFGYMSTLDSYLRALGRKFGEDVTPE